MDPFHCRSRTWVLFSQCMQSTGDIELGSLEPDQISVHAFLVTTASRPAKGSVDRAHREDVDRPRLGRPSSLCMGSTCPTNCEDPFHGVLFTIFLVTLGGTLATLFGLI